MRKNAKPLRSVIYEKLVSDILSRKINPGEKLLESELTERFGVSRTPVRETLFQLEKDGYVTHKKNIGAIVSKISEKTVRDFLDVIAQLEAHAVELFVKKGVQEEDINHLKALQLKMERAAKKKEYNLYTKLNLQFHDYILKKNDNKVLRQIVLDLRKRLFSIVPEGITLPLYIDKHIVLHNIIIKLISEGNHSQANLQMKKHINTIESTINIIRF
jgi:DNA-binding GntR family transcriptional regulator